MNPILPFAIGVCAGIVVNIIVFLFKKGYVPLLNLFNGNSIAGTWISEYKEGETAYHETIYVRQVWRSIYATAVLTEEGKPTEKQEIKGTYKNQILTAEYWSTEKNVIERGTFTLKRVTPERLTGFFTFFSGDPLQLQESPYSWKYSK
jgi:predicted small secreted protein